MDRCNAPGGDWQTILSQPPCLDQTCDDLRSVIAIWPELDYHERYLLSIFLHRGLMMRRALVVALMTVVAAAVGLVMAADRGLVAPGEAVGFALLLGAAVITILLLHIWLTPRNKK
jgi:hypothetical protein